MTNDNEKHFILDVPSSKTRLIIRVKTFQHRTLDVNIGVVFLVIGCVSLIVAIAISIRTERGRRKFKASRDGDLQQKHESNDCSPARSPTHRSAAPITSRKSSFLANSDAYDNLDGIVLDIETTELNSTNNERLMYVHPKEDYANATRPTSDYENTHITKALDDGYILHDGGATFDSNRDSRMTTGSYKSMTKLRQLEQQEKMHSINENNIPLYSVTKKTTAQQPLRDDDDGLVGPLYDDV